MISSFLHPSGCVGGCIARKLWNPSRCADVPDAIKRAESTGGECHRRPGTSVVGTEWYKNLIWLKQQAGRLAGWLHEKLCGAFFSTGPTPSPPVVWGWRAVRSANKIFLETVFNSPHNGAIGLTQEGRWSSGTEDREDDPSRGKFFRSFLPDASFHGKVSCCYPWPVSGRGGRAAEVWSVVRPSSFIFRLPFVTLEQCLFVAKWS